MSNVVAIIQARMGSTRLPGKVMMEIAGRPMLWHILNRVRQSRLIDGVIVATSTRKEDKVIGSLALTCGAEAFYGSDLDVLDRYYWCAEESGAETIVRITADDPFKDPAVIDLIVRAFSNGRGGLDYVSNTIKPTFPEGLDVEVFSYSALESAWSFAKEAFDREHVTAFMWRNPNRYRLLNIENWLGDLSRMRWTVDTPEDMTFARAVYDRLFSEKEIFLMEDILSLLREHPEISRLNENVEQRGWTAKLSATGSD